jgi:hypothetical protein
VNVRIAAEHTDRSTNAGADSSAEGSAAANAGAVQSAAAASAAAESGKAGTDDGPPPRVYTIGHSNHALDQFLALLRQHQITAVADVRSDPHSRYNPQYNRELLETSLRQHGIAYVFLGRELGARRHERECYVAGVARYERIARMPAFQDGLERVLTGAVRRRVALMCAEKDPLTCHRTILVCRHLKQRRNTGVDIQHVLEDGRLESHADAELRLSRLFHPEGQDLFRSQQELIEDAYERQAERIQYTEQPDGGPEQLPSRERLPLELDLDETEPSGVHEH